MKSISLVAIPAFLLTTMKSVGISLADINVFGAGGTRSLHLPNDPRSTSESNYTTREPFHSHQKLGASELSKFFKNKLSNNDIHDLVSSNDLLCTYVLGLRSYALGHLTSEIPYLEYNNYFNDKSSQQNSTVGLLQFLSNSGFIISEDNYKDTFELRVENDTLFLILKEGFGNLVHCNRSDLKDLVLDLIIEQSFNSFGEQITINSGLFGCYLGKLLNKKIN